MVRPLDNPALHDLLEQIRTRTGNAVIYRQGSVRKVLRALGENRGVAILIDQHLHATEAVYVNFFGRPAATTSIVASLVLRTGAAYGAGVRPAAARWAIPVRLRSPGGAATRRLTRVDSRFHAALHRRHRGVRPEVSGAVAVDAPQMAPDLGAAGRRCGWRRHERCG